MAHFVFAAVIADAEAHVTDAWYLSEHVAEIETALDHVAASAALVAEFARVVRARATLVRSERPRRWTEDRHYGLRRGRLTPA